MYITFLGAFFVCVHAGHLKVKLHTAA